MDEASLVGTYHLASSGSVSWYGFAEAIFEGVGATLRPKLTPITTAEYPTPAPRPANSVLASDRFFQTFGLALGPWQDSLALCVEEIVI